MTKQCNNCLEVLSLDSFYLVNKRGKEVSYHICKTCCATQKQSMKSYYRNWELKKKYGISLETYNSECNRRNFICDICNQKVKTLHVDHCHSTMRIRGYLCGPCNRGIGLLKDNIKTLQSAIQYLQNHDKTHLYS